MLEIIVNGHQIVIERNTSIQVELNNNIFNTAGIEGDVAYSFDVPAKPNDIIFNSARFVYVQRRRKYDCKILLCGITIGNGSLYITKSTKDTYNCEMSVNAFPDGWRDRKLSENEYGEDIVISEDYAQHKQKWIEFLQSTLSDDSVVKFPLFLDDGYYKSNDDFGMINGKENIPIGLNPDFQRKKKFVNRLAYSIINGDKNVSEFLSIITSGGERSVESGFEIFNKTLFLSDNILEQNQVSFSPAFPLKFILKNIVESGGYRIKGNLYDSNDFRTLWFQSLVSMDSTIHKEYVKDDSFVQCSLHESITDIQSVTRDILPLSINTGDTDDSGIFNSQFHTYKVSQDGVHHFSFRIKFFADMSVFSPNRAGVLVIKESNGPQIPYQINFNLSNDNRYEPDPSYGFLYAEICPFYSYGQSIPDDSPFSHYCKINGKNYESYVVDGDKALFECEIAFEKNFQISDIGKEITFSFTIGKMSGAQSSYAITNRNDLRCDAIVQVYSEDVSRLNIFKKNLKFSEYMPSITNSEFINTLKKLYGIAIFIDSATKSIEFTFIKDIINAEAIDLTSNLLDNELQIDYNPKKNETFIINPIDNPSEENERLDDVEYMDELPEARINVGRSSLVKHLNEIYVAEKIEDKDLIWKYVWNRHGGNDSLLKIDVTEEDNNEEIKPGCVVPSVEFIASKAPVEARLFANENSPIPHPITDSEREETVKLHFPEINGECVSYLNGNESASNVPFIIMRLLGDEPLPPHTNYDSYNLAYIRMNWANPTYIQRFSPVCYDNGNNRVPGNDLTATGENSIGEVFVKPWLSLLSNYEKITYRFLFSPAKLLEVMSLFRPQDRNPDEQTRWIFVENVKVLPIRMTFEIVEGKDNILAEIECAKPFVELD